MQMFSDFGLFPETLKGLNDGNFLVPTKVQLETLPFSLARKDVLAQAKTGSGKTLAFLVPILEHLAKEKWNKEDGLGALVISPTRELAMQIFKVLRKVGKYHQFSAGLLIGGKDLKQEQERVMHMNILICTPGRLLQHMDVTPDFDCNNLQTLVLDEADRILDAGFESTLNAIIANLPKQRQTLLFSATQTKAVKDLARLSIKDAEYVSVDRDSKSRTPKKLSQRFMVCPLPKKLDILYSFLRTHLQQKTLVFISSCKQVRFVFEFFCKMQPGIPLMCLHGKQSQDKRMMVFEQFNRKKQGVLFATDVASRGLDFPEVDWVLQVDCPDDTDTYIHRVGRTARNESSGQALLLLNPSEIKFIDRLETKQIPIEEIKANPAKTESVQNKIASICSQSPDMKYLAQKAFICYMRSIYLQKDKEVFDVHALPAEEFAEALGLHGTPKMKFKAQHVNKNKSRDSIIDTKISASMKKKAEKLLNDAVSDSDDAQDVEKKQPKTRVEKMFKQKNLTVLSDHYKKLKEESDESDGDLLVVSRKDHDLSDNEVVEKLPKKKRSKQKRALEANGYGVKLVFDENGEARPAFELEKLEEFEKTDVKGRKSEFIQKQAEDLKEKDIEDKIKEKERRKSRKLEKKLKEKMKAQDEHQVICVDKTEEALVTLGPPTYDSFEADDAINTADSISAAESRESENSCSESENSDSSESEIQQNKRKSAASIPVLNKKQKLTDQLGKQELEALALKLLEE